MASRLISARACTYAELINGSLNLQDVFTMLQILDFADYSRAKAETLAAMERERSESLE